MTLSTIYPNGVNEVEVPATESIAISNYGGGIAKIYYLVESANYPAAYQFQQTLEDGSVTLGAFTTKTIVKIESGASKVIYDVGAAPDTGVGDADTLGGELPSYYTNATNISSGTLAAARLPATYAEDALVLHKSLTEDITGEKTITTIFVLNNAAYIQSKETGGTKRTVLGANGSDVFLIGNAAFATDIRSNGTLTYNSAPLASGTIDTTATQIITVVDGLITSIA